MDARNFTFMFYGFAAIWAIVAVYVVYLGTREGSLRKQLDNLRRMVEEKDGK